VEPQNREIVQDRVLLQRQLKERTKQFALRIIRLFRSLPRSPDAQAIGRQLRRSGMSVGANYRAATRARSRQEFAAKIGIVVEEADETVFWLELLTESGLVPLKRLQSLAAEACELTAIFTASHQTARNKR